MESDNSQSQDGKKASRSQHPLCLNQIAEPILAMIKEKQPISYVGIADSFIKEVSQKYPNEFNEKTIRRRVYDVLNVFYASNVITRDEQKNVTISNIAPKEEDVSSMPIDALASDSEERVREKMDLLVRRTRLLIYYKLLAFRNTSIPRPQVNVQLPSIFIGYDNVENGSVKRCLDGKQLEIESDCYPKFFSPKSVFDSIGFSKEDQLRVLSQMPYLKAAEQEIKNDINQDGSC